MHYEYTEKMMYNQLLYFSTLFDVEKAKSNAKGTDRGKRHNQFEMTSTNLFTERVMALAEHNRVRFDTLKGIVEKYLDKCGRQWVAMDSLFGKLGFMA